MKIASRVNAVGIASFLLRISMGFVFLGAGYTKIQSPYDFLGAVYDYELFSREFGVIVATTIPVLELVVGAALVIGLMLSGACFLAMTLSLGFAIVQVSAIQRGLDISCGCFGELTDGAVNYTSLSRVLALLLLCSVLLYAQVRRDIRRDEANLTGAHN